MTVDTDMIQVKDNALVSNFCDAAVHDYCALGSCVCDCHVNRVVWGSDRPNFLSTVGYEIWRSKVSDVKVIEILVRNAYEVQGLTVSNEIVSRLSYMMSGFVLTSDNWAAWRFDELVREIVED